MVNVVSVAAYRWIYWLKLIGLVQRSAATWRSCYIQLNEPGELSQWLCHNDSTINIGTGIININIIIINIFHITIINTGFSLKSPTYPRNLSGLPTSSFIIITIHCKQSKHRYFNSAPKKLN